MVIFEKLIRWDEIFDSEGMKHAALEAPTEKSFVLRIHSNFVI